MKPSVHLAIFLLSQFCCVAAFAQTSPTETHPNPTEAASSAMETCPSVTSLVQMDDMSWIAPDGWKSSSPALYHELNEFVGAQWVGVNVGEVICIYTKTGRNDFPVNLQRSIIVFSPYGGAWTDDKGGYKDCKANDPAQCPFKIKVASTPKNVYDELDFFKDKDQPTP